MSFNILDTLDSTQHGTREDAVRTLQIQCNSKHKKEPCCYIFKNKSRIEISEKISLSGQKRNSFLYD